jgi:hypothetical protein
MPEQIIGSSSAPIVDGTPDMAASPRAQSIRFGKLVVLIGTGAVNP